MNGVVRPVIGVIERFPLSVLIYLRLNAGSWEGFSTSSRLIHRNTAAKACLEYETLMCVEGKREG